MCPHVLVWIKILKWVMVWNRIQCVHLNIAAPLYLQLKRTLIIFIKGPFRDQCSLVALLHPNDWAVPGLRKNNHILTYLFFLIRTCVEAQGSIYNVFFSTKNDSMLKEKVVGVTSLFCFFSAEYGRRKRNAFRIQVEKGSSVSIMSKTGNFLFMLWLFS